MTAEVAARPRARARTPTWGVGSLLALAIVPVEARVRACDANDDCPPSSNHLHRLPVPHLSPSLPAQAAISNNHLLNTLGLLSQLAALGIDPTTEGSTELLRAKAPGLSVLVGDSYYAAKEAMLAAEQRLLRKIRFQLPVEQPHYHLLCLLRASGLLGNVSQVALCMLNDVVLCSALIATVRADLLAAGVAVAAWQHVQQRDSGLGEPPQAHDEGNGVGPWAVCAPRFFDDGGPACEALGTTRQDLLRIAADVMAVLAAAQRGQ